MKTTRQRAIASTSGLLFILLVALVAPTHAQSESAPQVIETDDPRVLQSGTWSSQTAAPASNGSYLFNDPSPVGAGLRPAQNEPVLALAFVGSAIEVIYLTGPQFGTLAIEIDGTVVRTVITTAEKIAYAQAARVDYLSDEPHSLKVYAQAGGTIAVDAFLISPSPVLERGLGGEVNDGEGSGVRSDFGPGGDEVAPTALDDGGIQSTSCGPINAIRRTSQSNAGVQGNHHAYAQNISADGRFVVFHSSGSLMLGDGDALADIYLYDRLTCTIELISVSSAGLKSNGESYEPHISPNGRYVSFMSTATNLAPNDPNGLLDIYVRDRQLGITELVTMATGGTGSAGGSSFSSAVSADGRHIVLESDSASLVAGDTNGFEDIFVRDRQTGTTTRISVATGGTQAVGGHSNDPDISDDGRFVTFQSDATNLVAGDTNGATDIFLHDRQTNTTTRISVNGGGAEAVGGGSFNATLSANGRFVVFDSDATNLVTGDTNNAPDVFSVDRLANTIIRVSVTAGGAQLMGASSGPTVSSDGRYVAFHSDVPNLVAGDTNGFADSFVRDQQTNTLTRVSVAAGGRQATTGPSFHSRISDNGAYVAFISDATDLVTPDTNGFADVFLTPRVLAVPDTLALFNPPFNYVSLLSTLQDNPPYTAYTAFSAYAPVTGGQWVMGDWNGDGLDTPGVYLNGPFYYTNKSGESQPSDWRSLWIGVVGPPVSGHLNGSLPNDCIGAVQSANFGGFGTAFVLYYTCDLSGAPVPVISFQWLSIVLPDSGGFSGPHQFGTGDFNSDGVDSIAVRRGTFIAFGDVPPPNGPAAFNLAQFIGAPSGPDIGSFVVGDWNADGTDSFGLFYQNGEFFYRNDLTFNSGTYVNQSVGVPFAGTVQATTWR